MTRHSQSNHSILLILAIGFFSLHFSTELSAITQDAANDAPQDFGLFVVKKSLKNHSSLTFNGGGPTSSSILEPPKKTDRVLDIEKQFDPHNSVLWISFKNKLNFEQLNSTIKGLRGIKSVVIESTIAPDLDANGKFYSAIRSALPDKEIKQLKKAFPKLEFKKSAWTKTKLSDAI